MIDINSLTKQHPILEQIIGTKEVFWTNPLLLKSQKALSTLDIDSSDVEDAEKRLARFAPYIAKVFPETAASNGFIESPLTPLPQMQKELEDTYRFSLQGKLLLKCDSHLPISGSIKARGGIYTVLKHAETLAIQNGLLNLEDDYSILDSEAFRSFFSGYSIAVGSTGNLGLSIGIMSAKLGFKVTVHMSADAKAWKKDLLRSKGVIVVEYESDYSKAVEEGRRLSLFDPKCFFIDDENSVDLFMGYAVAAGRLKKQLEDMNISIDADHPLFVYLPCGVGGGPGGVAFGLKLIYGDNVHCFFAEPTHSPCMLVGLLTGLHDKICVQDLGIDNITDADGLAVGRASGFVGKTLEHLISGVYTVEDNTMYGLLRMLADSQHLQLEPSALAGMPGPIRLLTSDEGKAYVEKYNLFDKLNNAVHISWATGGSMVPPEVMKAYYIRGSKVLL